MSEAGFERVWASTVEGIRQSRSTPKPSPALKGLLRDLYEEACRRPPDNSRLHAAIEGVLRFLGTEEGRTHDNCWVMSNFLMPGDDHWEVDWADLPEPYRDVLSVMGTATWQAVEDPVWCENFDGLPEQVLDKLTTLRGDRAG